MRVHTSCSKGQSICRAAGKDSIHYVIVLVSTILGGHYKFVFSVNKVVSLCTSDEDCFRVHSLIAQSADY